MKMDWIVNLLAIDVILVCAVAGLAVRISAFRRGLRSAQSETAELRSALETLRSQAEHLRTEAPEVAEVTQREFAPMAALSADQRAEALDMLRNGIDSATVSARLQLPPADAALLANVQSLLGPALGR